MDKKFLKENKDIIINLYKDENLSASQIAEKFGKINEYAKILRLLKKNNIPIRKWGETRSRGKLNLDIDYFKEIDSHEKAYWLGFLYADGSINYRETIIPSKITLALKDKEPIINFKKAIQSDHKLSKTKVYDNRTSKIYIRYGVQITSKHFAENVVKWGLIGKSNANTLFPNVDKKYYWDFIRGLFDGDGSIISGKRIQLLGTEEIIKFIQKFLIEEYGFNKTKFYYLSKLKIGYLCSFLIDARKDLNLFFNKMYENSTLKTRLTRKYNCFIESTYIDKV